MKIVQYGPVLPANQTRTRLLNGLVRGNTAGFVQKKTVICQWASLTEIDEVRKSEFPPFQNNTDITGIFVMDGEPSIESPITPDHYIKNATLTGTAWLQVDGGTPGITASRGSLASA